MWGYVNCETFIYATLRFNAELSAGVNQGDRKSVVLSWDMLTESPTIKEFCTFGFVAFILPLIYLCRGGF